MFTAIVAYDSNLGIGKNGTIPWKLPEDMRQFKQRTLGNVVIMGRKTYESIGKPLPNRVNLIISRTLEKVDDNKQDDTKDTNNCKIFKTPLDCVRYCTNNKAFKDKKLFVIGGADIYKWFYENEFIKDAYITEVSGNYNCDVHFLDSKKYPNQSCLVSKYNCEYHDKTGETSGTLMYYTYTNLEEQNQLNLMNNIIKTGVSSGDRTGTGIIKSFGYQLRFSLLNNRFPLMTSRSMFFRGIFEELMFYLRGQTDNSILEAKGIKVWTPNTTREFLDSRNLHHLPTGDMGHSYGFSFRHFGGKYIDCKTNYDGVGYDQLAELIKEIKTNPTSRRLIISLWEPNHMHKAALPPCLYNYQFDVSEGKLNCMMTQRSSDQAVAGGWNVATGALLTILIAHVCKLLPGELIWNIGNAHIYENLVEPTMEQLSRVPYLYPKLYLRGAANISDICEFQFANMELVGYQSHPVIKFVMSV
jgi:dihydrofolate reductase/thymidylate synthase